MTERRDTPGRPPAGSPTPSPAEGFDREINVKAIVYTGVGLTLTIVLSMLAMWWMSVALKKGEERADPAPPPLAAARAPALPSGPRLQGAPGSSYPERQAAPELELAAMRAAEERALTTYSWVDEEAGTARVPIEVAIDLLVERGLPGAAPPEPVAEDGSAAAPGSSAAPGGGR